jgi:hypothetical protein
VSAVQRRLFLFVGFPFLDRTSPVPTLFVGFPFSDRISPVPTLFVGFPFLDRTSPVPTLFVGSPFSDRTSPVPTLFVGSQKNLSNAEISTILPRFIRLARVGSFSGLVVLKVIMWAEPLVWRGEILIG